MPENDMQTALIPEDEVPLATVSLPKITLRNHHHQIMAMIHNVGPLSDQQLAERLNLADNSIRPRRKELSDRLYLEPHGKITLPTGNRATTWALTMRGVEQVLAAPKEG
ncbi:MAG: hypothetical protein FJ038_04250 [Chloroflexi bacterium]|nr:hypothetical protein [Chloroflexota bacterium]